jgi:hypothetical protein
MVRFGCNVARFGHEVARTAVLKLLAALSIQASPAVYATWLVPIVSLIYRFTNSTETEAQLPSSVRALAQETFDLISAQLGPDIALAAMNQERARVSSVRLQRKKNRAVQLVMDPEAAFEAKQKKARAKAKQKKRKIEEYKLARGKPSSGIKRKRDANDK